ncbi:MAG TPA: S1 family peptidase [Pseudonocardiaceae bacterium]|nr:S1 family peptidase [Pseudonocardiaceae bacterium]
MTAKARLPRKRWIVGTIGLFSACVTTIAIGAPSANAAPSTTFAPSVQPLAVHSLATSAGISPDAALRELHQQPSQVRLLNSLDQAAGGYLDAKTGAVVVNVLDPAAARRVTAAGAVARQVRYSTSELRSVKAAFDRLAGVPNTAWGIDPASDQVVLTISDAAPSAGAARLIDAATQFGDQVRVAHSHGVMRPFVADGDEIDTDQWICSAGFNVNKNGQNYIIDAGHCTQGLPNWNGIGPSIDSQFPGADYGLIENDSSDAPGSVDLYDGTTQTISSAGDATVGEQLCKSGRTTNVTCGSVSALDQTVDYGNGDVVNGLVQTNVQAGEGDSGGPWFDGSTGLGTTSGGDSSTTYFQPLSAAMSAYGVSLN